MALRILENVPLAPLTTFALGGPARFFVEVGDEASAAEALRWAAGQGLTVTVLGGGSNVVVADEGVDGLVLRVVTRGVVFEDTAAFDDVPGVLVTAQAGEPWDSFVAECVGRGLAGLECLSGIPGLVGAAPVQNVGAYGQEVSETIRSVRVLDRVDLGVRDIPAEQCGFGYRDSFFKRVPDRFVVLGVSFGLRPGGAPAIRYAELERALGDERAPSLARVRETVVALRRKKSMVLDPEDPNRRCAGSFFTNPIVPAADAERVARLAVDRGIVESARQVPRWPAADGLTKLAAAWLIERAGIDKGLRRGNVGISSRHCLALVHHGGGTTAELLALAREVEGRVRDRWGVTLVPEPTLLACAL